MAAWRTSPLFTVLTGCTLGACFVSTLCAGDPPTLPPLPTATLPADPPAPAETASLVINLPAALQLANANPLDIALATQRLQAAVADQDRANVLWLPSLYLGADYARHDGKIQDIVGKVFNTSRSSMMVGAGPAMVFAVTDALYQPLAARQLRQAREHDLQTARNDSTLAVVEAYFNVQQARGEAAGAADAVKRAEDLAHRAEKLAPGLIPGVEVYRVRTELARRRQAVESANEQWETSSAELIRLLRLNPNTVLSPMEPPHLRVELIPLTQTVDALIPIALTHRPELASHQAIVKATLARLQQEKLRPLIPSLLIRGNATNPASPLSTGYFGGGVNGNLTNFSSRNSIDVQVLWELQNLGMGNHAAVKIRKAENELAMLELFRVQDRIAAEVARAHAQARRAVNRLHLAEEGLKYAQTTVQKNLEGLSQTKRVGEIVQLVFRPQEVVAAITALDQAYRDYYAAVADANRAQFRLYRALGHPAQCLVQAQAIQSAQP